MKKYLGSICLGVIVALLLFIGMPVMEVLAATTADVSINATPAYVSINVTPTGYSFGVIGASTTPSTATNYFTIGNGSSVATNQTISVTTSTWSGGVGWTHSDTADPDVDTAGLKANKGGTWGAGDVIVKYTSPNKIAIDQEANTGYSFGLMLIAPTEFTDGVKKEVVVKIIATYGS